MNKIKVIDLLNKIANGEEVPNKIKYNDKIYYYFNNLVDLHKYETMPTEYEYSSSLILRNEHLNLNDEVEIIEEDKKIEKLYGEPRHIFTENELYLAGKINEIIDFINGSDKE